MRTDPLSQLLGRKQTVSFNDGPLPMHPLWLDGIEALGFSSGVRRAGCAPFPVSLTCWLCSLIQVCTILLICQEALSQISKNAHMIDKLWLEHL